MRARASPHLWWDSLWNVVGMNALGCRRLLDLGCGSRRVLERLMKDATVHEAFGMDSSREKLLEAHIRCPSAELMCSVFFLLRTEALK